MSHADNSNNISKEEEQLRWEADREEWSKRDRKRTVAKLFSVVGVGLFCALFTDHGFSTSAFIGHLMNHPGYSGGCLV